MRGPEIELFRNLYFHQNETRNIFILFSFVRDQFFNLIFLLYK